MTFEEQVKKAGLEMAELKEAFIIEEITPYLEDNTLKQKLRLRLQEKEDWKDKVREAIDKVLETSMLNGKCYCDDLYEGECDNCKAKELKKELGI